MRLRAVVTGVAGGLVSGLTGIGGGTVMVPLLTGLLRLPQRRAHATSLVIVIFVAVAASTLYAERSEVEWLVAAALAVGGVTGAQLGARTMQRVADARLRTIFALFLLLVGLRLLVLG